MCRKKMYVVTLTAEERSCLQGLLSKKRTAAHKQVHARILLKADVSRGAEELTDEQVAEAVETSRCTVERVRQRFVEEGLEAALNRKKGPAPPPRVMDGEAEAHLITLACSRSAELRPKPAAGGACTLDLTLAGRPDGPVAIRRARLPRNGPADTKKNVVKPWLTQEWCLPGEPSAAFVCAMEDVIEVYHRPYDPRRPQVCMDESSKQLVGEEVAPLPPKPGFPERFDTHYVRNGVSNIFMLFEPLAGWRHVQVTDRHTRTDWAHMMKHLVDVRYPEAEQIVLVCDNLNTHEKASLYEAFPPSEARRIANKLEIHYTPKHGSWLNVAECELSILSRQCLARRIPDVASLKGEIAAWTNNRNNAAAPLNWRFTIEAARFKMRRLYPSIAT